MDRADDGLLGDLLDVFVRADGGVEQVPQHRQTSTEKQTEDEPQREVAGRDRARGGLARRRRLDERHLDRGGLLRALRALHLGDDFGEGRADRGRDLLSVLRIRVGDGDLDDDRLRRRRHGDLAREVAGRRVVPQLLDHRVERPRGLEQLRIGLHALLGEGAALLQGRGVGTGDRDEEPRRRRVALRLRHRPQRRQADNHQGGDDDGHPPLADDPQVVLQLHALGASRSGKTNSMGESRTARSVGQDRSHERPDHDCLHR